LAPAGAPASRPTSFIAATATASWFNEYGHASFFEDGPTDRKPSATIGSPSRPQAEASPTMKSPGMKTSMQSPTVQRTFHTMKPSATVQHQTQASSPQRSLPAAPSPPTHSGVETPDPFRAAAARARRVQTELQEAAKFRQFDQDGDGKMDAAELKALLNLESEAEALAIIGRLDKDGDGELDLGEVGDTLMSLRAKLEDLGPEVDSEVVQAAAMARGAAGLARRAQTEAKMFVQQIEAASPGR